MVVKGFALVKKNVKKNQKKMSKKKKKKKVKKKSTRIDVIMISCY